MTDSGPVRSQRRSEVAAYVAELAADLATVARRNGLDTLGYILEMARLEAEYQAESPASASDRTD